MHILHSDTFLIQYPQFFFFPLFYHMTRNIFFLIIAVFASIFVIALGMTTYRYYSAIHSDDPISPYLLVEK
jgi:hypothetical protein